jgi:hypothetical protein
VTIVRRVWPGLTVALLGLPIVLALLQRVPHINDFEIVRDTPGWQRTFVALGQTSSGGIHTAKKSLWLHGPGSPITHDEIRLLIVTYNARLALQSGELRVVGRECVYRTRPGAEIVNTDYLTFVRASACEPGDREQAELELTVSFRGNGRLGLVTYFVPPATTGPDWLSLTAPDPADPRPVPIVSGRYVDYLPGEPARRVDLLAYVWQFGDTSLIWLAVAFALAVFLAGTISMRAPEAASSLRLSLGVGAIGLGLAMLYATLVPPLQAPDEPDHVLAFANLANRPQLAESLAGLARLGHFDRIHFHPAERFRKVDQGLPATAAWNHDVVAETVAGRSLTTWLWWTTLAPAVGGETAARAILFVRLADAAVFAACLTVAAGFLLWTTRARVNAAHAVCLAMLFVPTLPFFATHVSEFALLTSTYVVLAAIIAALFLDGDRVHWLGLPLGLAASLILLGGRSGLPFVATLVAVIGSRAVLGSRLAAASIDAAGSPAVPHHDTRRALIFWSGLGLGLGVFAFASTPDFRAGVWPNDVPGTSVPVWFRTIAEWLRDRPWSALIVLPVGLGIEVASIRVRRRLPAMAPNVATLLRGWWRLVAAALLAVVVLSFFVHYPGLSPIEVIRPTSARAYTEDVLRVALTGLRLQNHDWLLSTSFWAGFGWLDAVPGSGFVTVLVALSAAVSIALCLQLGRAADLRRSMWLVLLSLGWVATLTAYGVSSYFLNRNLHGRYLVGLYLTMLAISGTSLALWPRVSAHGRWRIQLGREEITIAIAALIHGYALRFVLLRYF